MKRVIGTGLFGLAVLCAVMIWVALRDDAQSPVPPDIEKAFTEKFIAVTVAPEPGGMPEINFNGLDGTPHSSSDLKGQMTLINLWATFCAPCIKELPSLAALNQEFEQLRVIAISLDSVQSPDKIIEFMKTNSLPDLASYWDPEREVRKNLPARGLPTTLLVSANGRILYRFEGETDWMSAQSLDFFNSLFVIK